MVWFEIIASFYTQSFLSGFLLKTTKDSGDIENTLKGFEEIQLREIVIDIVQFLI